VIVPFLEFKLTIWALAIDKPLVELTTIPEKFRVSFCAIEDALIKKKVQCGVLIISYCKFTLLKLPIS